MSIEAFMDKIDEINMLHAVTMARRSKIYVRQTTEIVTSLDTKGKCQNPSSPLLATLTHAHLRRYKNGL
jgi:hypothetical protein